MSPIAISDPTNPRAVPMAQNDIDENASRQKEEIVCPDPSAHEEAAREKALQDQAATAALYVTHDERDSKIRAINPLGPDGRLSAASV